MDITMTYKKRKAIRIAALLAAMLVIAGCAGIQPYNLPNHREEGPDKGLFTGSQGEWVIVGLKVPQAGAAEDKNGAAESEANREEKKHQGKPADRQ